MVHRGTTRESKVRKEARTASTPDEKYRRHRNKLRIWRRAVKRLKENTPQALVPA